MKTKPILVAGVIGLSACAIAADRPRQTGGTPGDQYPSVRVLSKTVEAELGGKELAFVAAVRRDGTIQLYRPEAVKSQSVQLPLPAKSIDRIIPITLIRYERNPGCLIWAQGGAGGAAYEDFCLVPVP